MNTDDLLVAYKQGRRNFRGMQIEPGGLLFGECLDGADFSESRLTGVSFDHCDLNRTSFRNADISGTGFSCSSLVGADMTDARARGADMWQADLTRACLDGADFGPEPQGLDDPMDRETPPSAFGYARLVRASARGTLFDAARLDGADLTHMDATGAKFRHTEMKDVNLIGTCMHGADLQHAHLAGNVKVGLAGTRNTDFLDPEELPEDLREPSIHPDI